MYEFLGSYLLFQDQFRKCLVIEQGESCWNASLAVWELNSLEHLHPCSVCGLKTVLLTSKILFYFSLTSPIKPKLGLQNGRLLIATHLDQSNHLGNQQKVLGYAVPFASLSILCKNAG
jgi:hypothetical protein